MHAERTGGGTQDVDMLYPTVSLAGKTATTVCVDTLYAILSRKSPVLCSTVQCLYMYPDYIL